MVRYCWLFLFGLLLVPAPVLAKGSYRVERVADGVYAAIARPGSQASSNAFFVVGDRYVIAGGAHLSQSGAADLLASIAAVTDRPLRYFILPHHHRGYTAVDFDLPVGCDGVMSVQTWQALSSEVRPVEYPVLFFKEGLTLKAGKDRTVILTNVGPAHGEGDVLVYLPESRVLFTSDLVYVHNVGYLGDGHMTGWALALDMMTGMDVAKVIPGLGPVSPPEAIQDYRDYFKAFLSEVLRHLEKGDSLAQTRKDFRLNAYHDWDGYDRLTDTNIAHAYRDLKTNVVTH